VSLKSNSELKPETIVTYEVVGEQAIGKNLRATASAFTYRIRDLITQVTDPEDDLGVYENMEQVRAVGGELALEGKWTGGWQTRASCTIENAEDETTHTQISNSPHVLGKANLLIPLLNEAAFAGLELQYTGDRKTLAGTEAEEHLLANLTLFSDKLFKDWELSASLYNLFDTSYGDPGGTEHIQDLIEQDGRTFRVKATRRF
jgi:iron complex outermembrane receptor protein